MAPPDRLIAPDPAVAPVTAPPHVLVSVGVASTRSPEGNVSPNASVVMPPTVALLVMVSESVATPVPRFTAKLFTIVGVLLTTIEAFAAAVLEAAFDVVSPPIATVVLEVFAVAEVMGANTVPEPAAGRGGA